MLLLMQCIELNRDGLLLLPTRDGSFLLLFHCGLIKLLEKSLTQALFILQGCQVWPRCGGSAHENCLFLGQTWGVEKKSQTNISVWLWIVWDGPLDWNSGALEWGVNNVQNDARTANGKLPSPGVREKLCHLPVLSPASHGKTPC